MLTLRRGRVSAIVERVEGLARIEVDGTPCIAYPRLTGPVALGDEVIVNVQARELELGSGGFDVLYVNLTRGLELPVEPDAHVMKLPYTPLQFAARHLEEGRTPPADLDGLARRLLLATQPGRARVRRHRNRRTRRVRAGSRRGAARLALRHRARAERARLSCRRLSPWARASTAIFRASRSPPRCCGQRWRSSTPSSARSGPGSSAPARATVTAGWRLPTRQTQLRRWTAVRFSPCERPRRTRVSAIAASRTTRSPLSITLERRLCGRAATRLPDGAVEVDVDGWQEACDGLPLSHMGRGPDDDPLFFAAAFAAGRYARTFIS